MLSFREPLELSLLIPCAADGAGETVDLSGTLHVVLHMTTDGHGGVHIREHFNPQGVSGYGQTTGGKYQATGVTVEQLNATIGVQSTFINNFRVIGPGRGNDFIVHENFHVTVNANGTVTANVGNTTTSCT
jgi:hypothetical protein